jgi:ABC-2 type transport system permease protein
MGARQFFIMFFNNFLGQIRQVKRNMMLLLVPILVFTFMYLFYAFNNVEESYIEPLNIGIVVMEDSAYGSMVADSFMSYDAFTKFVHITLDDYDAIYSDFYSGNYDAILEIPDGFIDAVMGFSYNPVVARVNYTDPLKAILVKNFLGGYESYITSAEVGIMTLHDEMALHGFEKSEISSYNELISYDLIFTALTRNELFVYNEVVDIPSVGSITYFLIAIVVMFLMYIALFAAINLMREREEHCIETHGIRFSNSTNFSLQDIFSQSFAGSWMVMVWVVLFQLISSQPLTDEPLGVVLFLWLAIIFDVALAVLISSFFRRDESVILFSNVFIFINALIGGSIIPIHIMPDMLQKIAIISPNYWMIRGFLYFQSGLNLAEGYAIAWVIGLVSVLMIIIASAMYAKKARV